MQNIVLVAAMIPLAIILWCLAIMFVCVLAESILELCKKEKKCEQS
jgi:hypothetical protein